jgi:hypothetical protein
LLTRIMVCMIGTRNLWMQKLMLINTKILRGGERVLSMM